MLRNAGVSMLGLALLVGCGKKEAEAPPVEPAAPVAGAVDTLGTAEIHDSAGKVLGTVAFHTENGALMVSGRIAGLAPGEYGTHLHAVGLCEAPEFKTAGAHWNPTAKMHGRDNPAGPHFGDLANLVIGADSSGMLQASAAGGTFAGDSTSLMDADGASIVIHAGPDDNKTDPAGNSGARKACGVVAKK